MLAFNHLGRLGQLGNQMFQYAALKGIATKHGYEYMIPTHDCLLYTSPSPRDYAASRMPSSA